MGLVDCRDLYDEIEGLVGCVRGGLVREGGVADVGDLPGLVAELELDHLDLVVFPGAGLPVEVDVVGDDAVVDADDLEGDGDLVL